MFSFPLSCVMKISVNPRNVQIERFSNCRKTNTKVIRSDQCNHNTSKHRDESIRIPSRLLVTYSKGGKNSRGQGTNGFGFVLVRHCLKTGARFLGQSLSVAITIT